MPAISVREQRIRLNRVRELLAEGRTKQEICDDIGIHKRTLTRYMNLIREATIGDFDGKKVVDLWVAHKMLMEQTIRECKVKLDLGESSDVAPEKLYRAIQQASESIIDMGIKIGIVPPVTQQLSIDVLEKKEDDNLRKLLLGHKASIDSTTETEALPAPETIEE